MTAAAEAITNTTDKDRYGIQNLHFWLEHGSGVLNIKAKGGQEFQFASGKIYTLCSPERAKELNWGPREDHEDPQEGEIWLKIEHYQGPRDAEVIRIVPGQKMI